MPNALANCSRRLEESRARCLSPILQKFHDSLPSDFVLPCLVKLPLITSAFLMLCFPFFQRFFLLLCFPSFNVFFVASFFP
jgi:hypothetical protein